jgi:nitrite reductase (NADH) small subunit
MGRFVRVAGTNELSPGQGMIAQAEGREIALFNVGGHFFAIDNTCLHRGGPLGEGELQDQTVTCPWHGWQFNVTTGESAVNPAVKVQTFPVQVEGGNVLVEI